ncbi:hypothetical protein ABKA04_003279 [Annulohypoxylon sp. FPYF3050]
MGFATTFRDTVSILKQLFPLLLLLFRGLYATYEAIKSIKTKFLDHIPMSLSDLASHTQAMPTVQRQDLIRVPPSSDSDEARGDTNAPAAENEQDAHDHAEGSKSISNNQRNVNSEAVAVANVNMYSFISARSCDPRCRSYGVEVNTGDRPGTTVFIVSIAVAVAIACLAIAGFGFGYAVRYSLPRTNQGTDLEPWVR